MSEYIKNAGYTGRDFRWHLLTSVSALALVVAVPNASAGDVDRPLVWIDFGGNLNVDSGEANRFEPLFALVSPTPDPFTNASPIKLQKPNRFSYGGEASLSVRPGDGDWVFSAAVRYSRSSNKRHTVQATEYTFHLQNRIEIITNYNEIKKFSDVNIEQSERHFILDFQAGKDVGLGRIGDGGTSVVGAGVRVARFSWHSGVSDRARPDFHAQNLFPSFITRIRPSYYLATFHFPTYYFKGQADRRFEGIGPSLSWKASTPLAGNEHDGELDLDWSLNGSLLFGRQRAKTVHQTTGRYYHGYKYRNYITVSGYPNPHRTKYETLYRHQPPAQTRSRNVTVPNLGASIGLTYRIEDTKISLGYRTDYFFGAMDGGIDKAQKKTFGFNGLYASVSVGFGD